MNRREWTPRLGVVLGYVCLALAFTWPLPLHLGSRLTGDPGGDTGVYVWNQWVFQHEMFARGYPLTTEHIFSLTSPVDLSQHNYTAFLNVLALPLIPLMGVVAAFNVVLLETMVLTALCTYGLARLAFPVTRLEAFAAGAAFAWSPVLVARTTGHFSLVAGAPLAAFVYLLIQADRTRRTGYAAAAGLAMAWAAFSDPYFAVFCLVITGTYAVSQVMTFDRRPHGALVAWLLNVLILSVGGLVVGLALGQGGDVDLWGWSISMRSLYTPVMLLTLLALARVALEFRAHVTNRRYLVWTLRFGLVAGVACAGPLSPVLYGLGQRIADGRFVNPPILWRSSPRGVDLLALLHPNPNHPLSKLWLGDTETAAPVVFVEYTAALSLVALAVIAVGVWKGGFRPKAAWWWVALGFAALSLGPFIFVNGVNTHVPGPWALLRYVPVVSAVRTPTRFAIVAALCVAVLMAGALAALGERWPRRRRLVGGVVLTLLLFELLPAPRTLYSAEYSPLLDQIAADPRPVRVLNLPFGIRDGVSSAGNFSARSQFDQTRHGKALIGGYLSRVSPRRFLDVREGFPVLAALMALSDGSGDDTRERATLLAAGPAFVAGADLGYVLVDTARCPADLQAVAEAAFDLEVLGHDGRFTLYRPRAARHGLP